MSIFEMPHVCTHTTHTHTHTHMNMHTYTVMVLSNRKKYHQVSSYNTSNKRIEMKKEHDKHVHTHSQHTHHYTCDHNIYETG